MIRSSLTALAILTAPLYAEAPRIIAATAEQSGMGWRIEVTVLHPDQGWDHFVDEWQVLDAAGNLLGTRKLQHPHVNEQPFTRSLPSVMIPDGTQQIIIRAFCSDGDHVSADYLLQLSRY